MSVLMQLRAFDSLEWKDKFSSYRQFHDTVIENWNDLKKSTKREPFKGMNNLKELLLSSSPVAEWTMKELAENSLSLLGTVNVEMIMPEGLSEKLEEKGIRSIDEWVQEDIHWVLIVDFVKKKTKKNRPYLILTGLGTSGKKHKIFCWNSPADAEINKYSIFAVQLQNGDYGFSTNWKKILELNSK